MAIRRGALLAGIAPAGPAGPVSLTLQDFHPLSDSRRWIYEQFSRPQALSSARADKEITGILVLGRLPNPTIRYYFEERLKDIHPLPSKIHSIRSAKLPDMPLDGLFVIVCRYINQNYLKWLEENRLRFSGVALFVDDDLPAALSGSEASLSYKLYAYSLGIYPLPRLNRLLSAVWVSTENLQELLTDFGTKARLLPPYPEVTGTKRPLQKKGRPTLAFHATDIHQREHKFLKPILEAVLSAYPQARLEVTAKPKTGNFWLKGSRHSEQIFIEPMRNWLDYLNFLENRHYDLVLVPMMDDFINAARSDTKRIDICRMKAASIFSKNSIYDRCRIEGEVHIKNDPRAWIEAIVNLLENPEKRLENAKAVQKSLSLMRQKGELNFLEFCENSR